MNCMKQLLENDFIEFYGISSKVKVDSQITREFEFDLDDSLSPFSINSFGTGKVSLRNEKGDLEIIHYENFINQCIKPQSFLKNRKRCDYLLAHANKQETILLVEITSALGTKEQLEKPIFHSNNKSILFAGGKFEKCEEQLWQSLRDLKQVPSIGEKIDLYARKICLMAYEIKPYSQQEKNTVIRRPFNRYLRTESKTTFESGAVIPCPKIEALKFEYRRIEHKNVFRL